MAYMTNTYHCPILKAGSVERTCTTYRIVTANEKHAASFARDFTVDKSIVDLSHFFNDRMVKKIIKKKNLSWQ